MSEVKPTWSGEVQFRRYSDTSTQGAQITFGLPDRESLEAFIDKAGKRFMAVLVEIGDDELPVEPQVKRDQRGPLCREACELCGTQDFFFWVWNEFDVVLSSPQHAKEWMCGLLGIKSRKELDESDEAKELFIKKLRLPFMRFVTTREPI